jgi:hypothetical protein
VPQVRGVQAGHLVTTGLAAEHSEERFPTDLRIRLPSRGVCTDIGDYTVQLVERPGPTTSSRVSCVDQGFIDIEQHRYRSSHDSFSSGSTPIAGAPQGGRRLCLRLHVSASGVRDESPVGQRTARCSRDNSGQSGTSGHLMSICDGHFDRFAVFITTMRD